MNEKNLRPIKLSHEQAVKNGRKGGLASAKAKRKRKSIQTALRSVLDQTFEDGHGNELTGRERLVLTLFQIATNPDNRQSINAIRLILELTGDDRTEEEIKRDQLLNELKESEIRLTDTRIKEIKSRIWDTDDEE